MGLMITLNLNTPVTFELTTTGREMLERYYFGLKMIPPSPAPYYEMPLWLLAHVFGSAMYMGAPESPIVGMDVMVEV